jgi:hypothetical protein
MTLFEPPETVHLRVQPATLKRVGWSISRGVLLGAGLAALLFAWPWAGALVEGDERVDWFLVALSVAGAAELWNFGRTLATGGRATKAWLAWGGALALLVAPIGYFLMTGSSLRFTVWAQEQTAFTTLVIVCGIVGVVAARGGLRLVVRERSRVSLWFAAAVALWFSGEWAVKLGGVIVDPWIDPRLMIANGTVILAGILAAVGVLAILDWHIRRRDAEETVEGAPSERNGLSNG